MTLTDHTGYINVDTLAAMFKLPSWEGVDEYNVEYICEAGCYAYTEALKEGLSEEQAVEKREAAEAEAQGELFDKWHSSVMHAAEYLFNKHGLTLQPRRKGQKQPYEYKIVALKGWRVAAHKIAETINGVGYFHFSGVAELVSSGPYATERQAVLHHIHWIADYPAVYGSPSAERAYEQAWR